MKNMPESKTSLINPQTDQFKLLYLLFGLIVLASSILGTHIIVGGHIGSIIQLSAAIIIFSALVCGAFSQNARTDFGAPLSKVQRKFFVLDEMSRNAPIVGLLAAILGLIEVSKNLNNPDAIGPGIAISFVALFYSLSAYLVLNALRTRSKIELIQSDDTSDKFDQEDVSNFGMIALFLLLFSVFLVLFALKEDCPVDKNALHENVAPTLTEGGANHSGGQGADELSDTARATYREKNSEAELLFKKGEYGKAIAAYEYINEAYSDKVTNGTPLVWIGASWFKLKDYKLSRKALTTFLAQQRNLTNSAEVESREAEFLLAKIEQAEGFVDKALVGFKHIVQRNSTDDVGQRAKVELKSLEAH